MRASRKLLPVVAVAVAGAPPPARFAAAAVALLAVPLGVLGALGGCGSPPRAAAAPPALAVPVGEAWLTPDRARQAGIAVAPARVEELGRVLAASGRIAFDDQRVTHVFSPVTGRLVRLVAGLGQRVKQGDPLALIASPDLGSADSDYAKAQAALAQAEREYERQRELLAAHASAQRDFEAAEAGERQARAELARAEEKARLLGGGRLQAVTQQYVLRSPIAGEVIARAANPGVEVQGQYSGGATVELFTIGELDRVWVLADVFELDLGRIQRGAPVAVEVISSPGRRFTGRVDWISGTVDPATRTAKVRCAVDNSAHLLKPEMYAAVAIQAPGHRALAIPRAAVLRQGEQTVVFRETGRAASGALRFARWPVKVDDEGGEGMVAVLSGLQPGDRVVTAGGILLLGMI
ncbi:MAG TPA: efflux RND transporter periplasmic adaptor subunit [Thermoanaerobaculia bacterium]|nr:efflux RND transporter periplasmic adaptor subunit [Thermoanaerobaculia bacterium]